MRKRLDIYFIENRLIAKALDEFYVLMAKTLDTDDFISKKVDKSIKEIIEAKFKSDIKAIRKEVKCYLRKRNKAIKRGEIDHDAEFNNFLESVGVNFEEYLPAVTEATAEDVVDEAYEALTENLATESSNEDEATSLEEVVNNVDDT